MTHRTQRLRIGWESRLTPWFFAFFVVIAWPVSDGQELEPVVEDAGVTGALLSFHTDITDVTTESIKRRIEEARSLGAEIIIFDMDTPGGLVTSAIAIADLIRELSDIKTVAWIHPDAYSGGALVAVACDEIVMSRSSRIGDSQVIFMGPQGPAAVPDDLKPKVNTPVVHDFRTSAKLNGYSVVLSEAFVDPDREVWWLENTETGEREFVSRAEKLKRLGERTGSANVDWARDDADGETGKSGGLWKLVENYHDVLLNKDRPTNQPIVRDDELLQMSAPEAVAYGFSKAVVVDEAELKSRYDIASLIRLGALWSESLAHWLTSMPVRGFLLVIVMLGAYVEFHTPGVGVPGAVALVALGIFIGAPYVTGFANVWEIAIIALGVVLMLLELFVIPGFGVAGIGGLMCVVIGLAATFIGDEPGRTFPSLFPLLPATVAGLQAAAVTIVSAMFVSLLGMFMLSRFLPSMLIFQRMVPANPMPTDVLVEDSYRGGARVGDKGRTEGPLHPAGKARFGNLLVDVVTQGEFLETDAAVEIVEHRGNRVVVRAVT